GDSWGKIVEQPIGAGRNEILFSEQLDGIGYQGVDDAKIERQLAENGRAVGADAVLEDGAAFALDPQEQPPEVEHHEEHQESEDKASNEIDHGFVIGESGPLSPCSLD